MANELTECRLHCPYCDAAISVLVDGSVPDQSYVEDCEVCCRPIVLDVHIAPDSSIDVYPKVENE